MFRLKKSVTHYLYPWLNVIFLIDSCKSEKYNYFGRRIGTFRGYAHGVQGTVYAVDESTIYIQDFYYDGIGPDAYFWVGDTQIPSPNGSVVPYPESDKVGDPPVLRAHNGSRIVLKLPGEKKLKDIRWLSVWCKRFTVNFGEVFIPRELDPPKKRVLPQFKRLAHGLRSGNLTILDAKTFYIPDLHYDGRGPDAYFLIGNGSEPSQHGTKVPNELGNLEPLRAYSGEDIELQLPGDLTVYDIDWLAVYCIRYTHNFGHVMIPKDLDVPPALGQTKISPPWWYNPTSSQPPGPDRRKKLSNCREMLSERLRVRWQVYEDLVRIQLSAAVRKDQYIAFGISNEFKRPAMIGSDVVVAYYDEGSGRFNANDYYISATSQCDRKLHSGVCKDENVSGRNDVRLVHGEVYHGVTTIIFERPLQTNELVSDKPIVLNTKTNVIAAIGPLNSEKEPAAHATADKSTDNTYIDFGSIGDDTCPVEETEDNKPEKTWTRSVLHHTNVFSVRVGPSGGRKGFLDVTKKSSLGVSWYINGKLAPEIYVERGKTYTFIVEGGNTPENLAQYHPFYLTDSAEGAFGSKLESEQKDQRIFAGISYDSEGIPLPNIVGRFCEWAYKTADQTARQETFEQFFKSLELRCDPGEPAYLNWTVQAETPNFIYYQCYTHSFMGWKIFVEDASKMYPKKSSNKASRNRQTMTIIVCNYFVHFFLTRNDLMMQYLRQTVYVVFNYFSFSRREQVNAMKKSL